MGTARATTRSLFSGYRYFDFSAYCVLDNDFSAAEFGYPDPTLPLRVTAAHEFFHAIQFAYDLYEDALADGGDGRPGWRTRSTTGSTTTGST